MHFDTSYLFAMKRSHVFFGLIAMCCWTVLQAQQPVGTTNWLLIDDTRGGREIACDVRYPGVSATSEATPDNGPFPLVVFGHGFLMGPQDYDDLAAGLVHAGYVVALVATEQTFAPSHQNFGLDLAFVANEMVQNGASGILEGWLQPHAAIAGHSMGGGATWLAAATNPMIDAVVVFAPAETNPSAVAVGENIQVPVLVVSGSADGVTPPDTQHFPLYNSTTGAPCRAFASLLDGGHCGFADQGTICDIGELGFSGLTHAEQLQLSLGLMVPWLDAFLRDDPLAWGEFEAYAAASDDVILELDCALSIRPQTPLNLQVYPNPTSNSMTLRWVGSGQKAEAQVVDLLGRVHQTWALDGASDSHALELEPGLYVLNISQQGKHIESVQLIFH